MIAHMFARVLATRFYEYKHCERFPASQSPLKVLERGFTPMIYAVGDAQIESGIHSLASSCQALQNRKLVASMLMRILLVTRFPSFRYCKGMNHFR